MEKYLSVRSEIVNRIDLTPYRFEALIFDCDGTLVNSAPTHVAAK